MSHELNELSQIETANIAAMTVLTAFWFACLGACFGSFLNVVIYRLPRGRSLWREPSRCPACETRIAWSDNLPLVGWLRLRGRCRTCNWSIPLRYPLVEAIVAADFLFLLFVELLSGGANLPVRSVNMYTGVVWMVWYAMAPDLLAIYAYHLVLFYTALALVLWEIDEQPVPRSWGIGAIGLGVIATAVMPGLHPLLTNMEYRPAVTLFDRFEAVGDAAAGAVAGCLCAIALSQFLADRRSARGMVWMSLLAGTYLGFNGTVLWAAWWLLLSAILMRAFRQRPGVGVMIAALAALHVQLATWRPIWRMVEGIQAG